MDPQEALLQQQRQEADKQAMVRALFGEQPPANQPYGSFAEHFSESAVPAWRQERQYMDMIEPLVHQGTQRPQWSAPPARFPNLYDFTK